MSDFRWTRPHLLSLADLSAEEINFVLETADGFREVSTRSVKKVPALRGRVVVNAFFEDSTRTRMSFSLAAQRLSADVLDFSGKGSSVSKGESLVDTVRNIEAMGVDVMVVRHAAAGAAGWSPKASPAPSSTPATARTSTRRRACSTPTRSASKFGQIGGLHVAVVGDIANSRVARSNVAVLTKLGASVTLVGPATLLPGSFAKLPHVRVSTDLDAVLPTCDVVNMLRVQHERMKSAAFPSVREYASLFGLTAERVRRLNPGVFVMHPGPMNRGVEIDTAVADGPNSGILQQVTNGLAVRMAVLFLVTQAKGG